MRLFAVPATYRAYVESQMRLIEEDIKRDLCRRDGDDARVRELATISSTFIDASETGTLLVIVGAPDALPEMLAAAAGAD